MKINGKKENKKMTLIEKLGSIDRKIIYIGMIAIMLLTMIFPIGLPLTIEESTEMSFNTLDNLEPGSVVGLDFSFLIEAMSGDYGPVTYAFLSHIFNLPIKIVFYGFKEDTVAIYQLVMNNINTRNKVYGQDFVMLGYIPGLETGLAIFAKNLREIVKQDYKGTDIDQIPMMTDINNAYDFDVFISISYGYVGMEPYSRQIYSVYHKPIIIGASGSDISMAVSYYQSKQIAGYVVGIKGAAEYELLLKEPGIASGYMDAISFSFIYTIILIIVGNISYFSSKKGLSSRFKGGGK